MKKLAKFSAFMVAAMFAATSFTSCEDDETTPEGSVDEVIDVANFKIKANADGTITFLGDVASNAKIKEFALYKEDGSVAYDFLEQNKQVKEKNQSIDENGKVTKEKVFNLQNIDATVPVDLYTLKIKTKAVKKPIEEKLGEILNYTIGASGSKAGSYLSIKENKHYTLDQAKQNSVEVVSISSADGKSVTGLKKASAAASDDVKAKAGKVSFYHNGASVQEVGEGDVIITVSGCICKINSFKTEASGDVTITAVTIKQAEGGSLSVDVSAAAKDASK